MISTKENLKKGTLNITYDHIKSLITCYILLGFKNTVKLINTGSSLITFEDLTKLIPRFFHLSI